MPASKVQDHQEVKRWFAEGRTYPWMVEEYRRRYNIETTVAMWSNYRDRHGLARRKARNDGLIPWQVKPEHRWALPLRMLRMEARLREGGELRPQDAERLAEWKRDLALRDLVVDYSPTHPDGFFYAPVRPGIDDVATPEGPQPLTARPTAGVPRGRKAAS